jgi:hypothetical protein
MKNKPPEIELTELVTIPYNLGVELAASLQCVEMSVLLGLTHLSNRTGTNPVELTDEAMEALGKPDPTAEMEFVSIPYRAMLDISRLAKDGTWAVLAKLLRQRKRGQAVQISSLDWQDELGLKLSQLFPILKQLSDLEVIQVKPPTLKRGVLVTVNPGWIQTL